jgi:RNA-directed DNA polymerase
MVMYRKEHSLTGRITIELMRAAFKKVKRNRGAAGVDKVSIGMFQSNLEQNLLALMKDLKSGEFWPDPLRRVRIPKAPRSTKLRPLGIPVVRDRVAQEVLRRLLEPIFEPLFHDASFGFRPHRNCHMAIESVLRLHAAGCWSVLDADIEGFLDTASYCTLVHESSSRSLGSRRNPLKMLSFCLLAQGTGQDPPALLDKLPQSFASHLSGRPSQ